MRGGFEHNSADAQARGITFGNAPNGEGYGIGIMPQSSQDTCFVKEAPH